MVKDDGIVGYVSLSDQVRYEAIEAVSGFQKEGIQVVLLTGDNERVAAKVAKEVKVNDYVANCLPEDKINYILKSQRNKR